MCALDVRDSDRARASALLLRHAACYGMRGTERAHGATRHGRVAQRRSDPWTKSGCPSSYVPAPCPVLTQLIVLIDEETMANVPGTNPAMRLREWFAMPGTDVEYGAIRVRGRRGADAGTRLRRERPRVAPYEHSTQCPRQARPHSRTHLLRIARSLDTGDLALAVACAVLKRAFRD